MVFRFLLPKARQATTATNVDAIEHTDTGRSSKAVYVKSDSANGDKVHQSPGSQEAAVEFDPALEKRVVRKLDQNLVSLVSILFLLSFLDRSNIGNARIAGMSEDLHLDEGDRYDWLLTIFYISYIVFQFQIIFWKVFPPHLWATFTVVFWGVVSTCQAAATNWSGMMALRFLLGIAEAGYGCGVAYLLSFFYLRHELGLRCGLFFAAAPLASCFAGALAYGITSGHPDIANWKLLFIVEGVPTLITVPFAYFFLPDRPQDARFLNEDEKRVAIARGVRQAGHQERVGSVDFKELAQTLKDPKPWLTALMYFSCNVSYSSLPVFLPTILKEMGFSGVHAQGLSAPPFFLSAVVTIATTFIADRTQQRGLMIIFLSIVGGVGYIMLAVTTSVGSRYAGSFLAAAGVFPAIGNILPWVMNNQGSDSRRGAGMVMLNLIGQCGPLLGTRVFPSTEGPYYVKGQSVCAAFAFFNAILALILRTLLVWENKKLDFKYGTLEEQREGRRADSGKVMGAQGDESEAEAVENYGPMYRYVL
ncbi:putative MFS transporter [Polychaeton citri CBS 116435]|uniref:MFS transporter n=1 Tax=Polychaeton citri CBS 116435 TaxID=1314669 RepID=A0A9P4Q5T0_9PEZI|nr:putative MFS transporter [Polychaeton citri CBS 116435]